MSQETTEVLIKQLKILQIELDIELQKSKVAELGARAKTLIAREQVEDFKLRQMEKKKDQILEEE